MTSPTRQTSGHVYRAINQVMRAFARDGIPKLHVNRRDQYDYRSIDDVLDRLSPLLAKHSLCVFPRVLSRDSDECVGEFEQPLTSVRLLVEFDLVSARDGSRETVRAWSEALDDSDKGTAKALTSAFKHAMLTTFCVPVSTLDTDSRSPRRRPFRAQPEPSEGWAAWGNEMLAKIRACSRPDDLDTLRQTDKHLLESLRRAQPALFRTLGECFQAQSDRLAAEPVQPEPDPALAVEPSRA